MDAPATPQEKMQRINELNDMLTHIQSVSKSKEYIQEPSLTWITKELHSEFDSFLDMLIRETEDRWLIPHYLVVHLDRDFGFGLEDLAHVLRRAIDDEIDLRSYVEDARAILKETLGNVKEIDDLFAIYDAIPEDYETLDEEERAELFRKAVGDNKYAKDWLDLIEN
jgi:hypothetical protein